MRGGEKEEAKKKTRPSPGVRKNISLETKRAVLEFIALCFRIAPNSGYLYRAPVAFQKKAVYKQHNPDLGQRCGGGRWRGNEGALCENSNQAIFN